MPEVVPAALQHVQALGTSRLRWRTGLTVRALGRRCMGMTPAARSPLQAQLSVRQGRAAVAFYELAFGAVEVYRVAGTDEHPAVVSQLVVGDAAFWVSDESPEHANHSPESLGGGTVRMLLIVDDPAAVVRSAVAAGAREVSAVSEQHNWRLGRIVDPFGHHWEIGKPLGAWPPAPARHS
jgi:PhnB protein